MNIDSPTPNLMTSLRALPRAAWFMFAGTFINRCGSLVMPFITIYMTRNGFTVADAGWTLAAYGLGNLGATLIGGHLADSIGRKNTMMLSLFSSSVLMCLLAQAHTLAGIQIFMFLIGLAGELYRPAVNALIADIIPAQHRLTAYAANRTALNAGWAFGPAIGGLLSEYSWTLIFYADGLSTLAFGLIALRELPHGNRSTGVVARWGGIWREIFRNRPFMAFAAANLCVAIVFVQINSTFSLLITDGGFEPWVYGLVNSLNGLLVVLIELPLTTITRRYHPRSVIVVGYFLIGLGMVFAGGANSIGAFLAVIAIFTLGEIIALPMASSYLAQLAPDAYRGRFMGVFGLTWSLAVLVGPKLGLTVYGRDPDLWWWICGALGTVAAILMLTSKPGSSAN
jgi:MFS family permease